MCCSIQLGLTQENMTKSSQRFFWFFIFQSAEGRKAHKDGLSRSDYVSMAWHWLQMHIWESPVKPVICCLYQRFVPPPPSCVWAASSLRESTCKRVFFGSEASFFSRSRSSLTSVWRRLPSFVCYQRNSGMPLGRKSLKSASARMKFEGRDDLCVLFCFFWRGITSSCLKIRSPLCVTL